MYTFFQSRQKKPNQRGFSLPEMLVVIAVIVIMTSVVLIDRRQFNESIRITSIAYDVALTIRQTQVSGIAVKGFESVAAPGTFLFDKGYGVSFREPTSGMMTEYVEFVDGTALSPANVANKRHEYEALDSDFIPVHGNITETEDQVDYEIITNRPGFSTASGYSYSFCAHERGDPTDQYDFCSDDPSSGIETLSIVFLRPDPDAYIYFNSNTYTNPETSTIGDPMSSFDAQFYCNQAQLCPVSNILDKALITIHSPSSLKRYVVVYASGQISVCRELSNC